MKVWLIIRYRRGLVLELKLTGNVSPCGLKLFYRICSVNQRYRDNTILAVAEPDHQQEITLREIAKYRNGAGIQQFTDL